MKDTIVKFFNKNRNVYIVLAILCLIAYINIFLNTFTLVDDRGAYNEDIQNFWRSIGSFRIQSIFYTLVYHIFGITAIPAHILSLSLHIVNSILLFILLTKLIDRKVALFASLLFAVHPINTEDVTWISGMPYLINTVFFNACFLTYIKFKKTNSRNELIKCFVWFILGLILSRTVWIICIPLLLVVIDQFFINKRFNLFSLRYLIFFTIPIAIYAATYISYQSDLRLPTRALESYINQQKLHPIIESAPYTIFTMMKQYIFPKDLIIYYDATPITQTYYYAMYVGAVIYLAALAYFWFTNRRQIAGILVYLIVALAPTFSPVKVTWYLSERYLYYGTGFYAALVVIGLLYLENKFQMKYITVSVVSILLILYTGRTIIRNVDYQNSRTLALATIRDAPEGFRAINDLGTTYLEEEDYRRAMQYYYRSLKLLPDGNTAVNNLGIIYIRWGIPPVPPIQAEHDVTKSEGLFKRATGFYNAKSYPHAMTFAYHASLMNPSSVPPHQLMAQIFFDMEQYPFAEQQMLEILRLNPADTKVYPNLGAVAFRQKKYDEAEQYMKEALKHDASNSALLQNLQIIQQAKQTSK